MGLFKDSPTWAHIKELGEAIAERLRGHDVDIQAIQAQMERTQKHINELQIEMSMLKCQLTVAQRQSLAQKLRDKGVSK